MNTQIILTLVRRALRLPKSAIGNRQSAILMGLLLSTMMTWAASSPFLIPFQGRLTNPSGVPYTNGQYTVIFNLYDQPVGGSLLWSETHQKIGVINGMVNVFLGSINTLTNVDFSQSRHLGITIDADGNPNTPDPEMVPRQMIIPAFYAKNTEKLNGYDWTPIFGVNSPSGQMPGGKILNNSITAGQIANNTITATQIANNTITSNQLVIGTITGQLIAGGTITSNQIAAGTITGQLIAGGTISSNQITAGGISAANLAPNLIGTPQLASGAVTLTNLAPRPTGTNVGVGGFAISLSSAANVSANLKVTISTSGRPVFVGLIPDTSGQPSNLGSPQTVSTGGTVLIVRDSATTVGNIQTSITAAPDPTRTYAYWPVTMIQTVDFPSAGVHTYTLQVTTFSVNNCVLVAYEL